jgi:hypothetical protein
MLDQSRSAHSRDASINSTKPTSVYLCQRRQFIYRRSISDLSVKILAALDRFVARRGFCVHLKSDGINFREVERQLRNMFRAVSDFFKDRRLHPPRWKANRMVLYPPLPLQLLILKGSDYGKLVSNLSSHHLRWMIGDQILTYKELTLLC